MQKMFRGFTLIEILIVFAVLAIVSTVSAVSFVTYNKTQTLSNTAKDIEQMLTIAKSRAQSQVKPEFCVENNYSLKGYEFRFCGNEECRAATLSCRNDCSDEYSDCTAGCSGESAIEGCIASCRADRTACASGCHTSNASCGGQEPCESNGDYEVVAVCSDEGGGEQAIQMVPTEESPPKRIPNGISVTASQVQEKTRFNVLTGGVIGAGTISIRDNGSNAERRIIVDPAGTIRENL